MLNFLRGRNLHARVTQPMDEYWDRRLGIHTFGYHPATGREGDREWYLHYVPTSYRDIFTILKAAALAEDDVFTDLGCGLGRVVFAASWAGARRATGVELISWLAEGAEENRRKSRLANRDIEFFERNALDQSLTDTSLLYIFHSFGKEILAEVLEKARTDRKAAGVTRSLRIAYVNPVCEQVMADCGWLRRVRMLPPRKQFLSSTARYDVSIWESLP
jgi:SAM-dependent methyltransferase